MCRRSGSGTRRCWASLVRPGHWPDMNSRCPHDHDPPVKVALPVPYLLTRTIWLDCVSDKAYSDRESLAADVVRVLKEEAEQLIAGGAAIVQFDEPVLTEVVFERVVGDRRFICGALGTRRERAEELRFASELLRGVGWVTRGTDGNSRMSRQLVAG